MLQNSRRTCSFYYGYQANIIIISIIILKPNRCIKINYNSQILVEIKKILGFNTNAMKILVLYMQLFI